MFIAYSDGWEANWERMRKLLAEGAVAVVEPKREAAIVREFNTYFSGNTNRQQRRGNKGRPQYIRGRMIR